MAPEKLEKRKDPAPQQGNSSSKENKKGITCHLNGGVARDERAGIGRLAVQHRTLLLDGAIIDALVGARPARPLVQHLHWEKAAQKGECRKVR